MRSGETERGVFVGTHLLQAVCHTSIARTTYKRVLYGVVLYVSRVDHIIVNKTYGTHKNLYIYLLLLTIFGPIYYFPPVSRRWH